INPTLSQLDETDIEVILAASKDAIVMVEGGAREASEAEMIAALRAGHDALQPVIAAQHKLRELVGKEKRALPVVEKDEALAAKVREFAHDKLVKAFAVREKLARGKAVKEVKKELKAALITEDSPEDLEMKVSAYFGELEAEILRKQIATQKQRIDGRGLTDIRPITIETGLLPRAHGSALFTRGETQALVTATLGTSEDIQIIDTLLEEGTKHFMLHYNFPPFSVGETKPLRSPGRREIGHGALAERSVTKVLPDEEQFPYVIRIVSEILESNGSSSMASVCGSSLAMMDAGVPIRAAVAGIAMGLIKEGDQYLVLSDILGDEDHLGDMDFKVAGTSKGITALQMDIKIEGLPPQVMEQALEQARQGRVHILGEMAKALAEPRPNLSPYAPRIVQIQINKEKIRDIIGPGGKVIRGIVEQTGAKIDVEDDGSVKIFSNNEASLTKAKRMIEAIVEEPIEGRVYRGKVRKIVEFGAFVEIIPGTDGLLHISQLADKRVNRVTDVIQEGDEIIVKCLRVEPNGKIGLSLREAKGLRPDAEGGGRLDEPPPNQD
ncbi:polyribonucleotide nucleotidyltransferase, partial [bacterium]